MLKRFDLSLSSSENDSRAYWWHPLFDEGRPMMMTGSQQRVQQQRWWRGGSLDDVDDAMLWSMAMKYYAS